MADDAARKFEAQTSPEDEHIEELSDADFEIIEEAETEDVSHEASEAKAEKRLEWQRVEMVRGEITEFSKDTSVQFEMRKDLDKREGDEPGEDMFLADKETGLSGVLDGLGGMGEKGSGAKASAIASETLPTAYKTAFKNLEEIAKDKDKLAEHMQEFLDGQVTFMHPNEKESGKQAWIDRNLPGSVIIEAMALRGAALTAHEKVKETGGNTTLTIGKTIESSSGKKYEVIVNSGDSGAFLMKAGGAVESLTQDDSAIDLFISKGYLTREESADPNHKVMGKTVRKWRAAMFQSVGMDEEKVGVEFQPRVTVTELSPGDRIVYLSDGIKDLERFQTEGQFDPEKAAEILKDAEPGANLASMLAEASAKDEHFLKEEWGKEQARAKIEGREPDLRKKPKLDEKTALIKEITETIELDDSDLEEVL